MRSTLQWPLPRRPSPRTNRGRKAPEVLDSRNWRTEEGEAIDKQYSEPTPNFGMDNLPMGGMFVSPMGFSCPEGTHLAALPDTDKKVCQPNPGSD
jgi:hypothetical protein